ncbi:MAG: hypothetical protein IPJ65_11875 [Archangiaceae bacterium]|nr:hypothetical protein [Archangiaceae bacterium]
MRFATLVALLCCCSTPQPVVDGGAGGTGGGGGVAGGGGGGGTGGGGASCLGCPTPPAGCTAHSSCASSGYPPYCSFECPHPCVALSPSCAAEDQWLLHFSNTGSCLAQAHDTTLTLSRDGGEVCAALGGVTLQYGGGGSTGLALTASGCQVSLDIIAWWQLSSEYAQLQLRFGLAFDGGSRVESSASYTLVSLDSCGAPDAGLSAYRASVDPAKSIGVACDAGQCPSGLVCSADRCQLEGWLGAGERCLRSEQCSEGNLCLGGDAGVTVCAP